MAEAAPLTAQNISNNPSILNGKTISGDELDGVAVRDAAIAGARFRDIRLTRLSARNVTFRDTVFEECWIDKSVFENVIFENCLFANARIGRSELTKVYFTGGKMTYKDRYEHATSQSYIDSSIFDDVLFENMEMNHASIDAITGSIFLRNLRNVKQAPSAELVSGKNLVAMIDSVTTTGGLITAYGGSVYAVNCDLRSSGLSAFDGVVFIEQCTMMTGDVIAGTVVVKDSKGNIQFRGGGEGKEWFISGTELLERDEPARLKTLSVFDLKPGTMVHIKGTKTPAQVFFVGGKFRVSNQVFSRNTIYRVRVERLDLQNVTLENINWEQSAISGGQWENVTIRSPANVLNTLLTGITAHNLIFPDGTPWQGNPHELSIKETTKPFIWEPVKVPTAEELGVKRPWPVITGAGKGK